MPASDVGVRRLVLPPRPAEKVAGQFDGNGQTLRATFVISQHGLLRSFRTQIGHRDVQELGQRISQGPFVEGPHIHEDLADPFAGLILLLGRLVHLRSGDEVALDEEIAEPFAAAVDYAGRSVALVDIWCNEQRPVGLIACTTLGRARRRGGGAVWRCASPLDWSCSAPRRLSFIPTHWAAQGANFIPKRAHRGSPGGPRKPNSSPIPCWLRPFVSQGTLRDEESAVRRIRLDRMVEPDFFKNYMGRPLSKRAYRFREEEVGRTGGTVTVLGHNDLGSS